MLCSTETTSPLKLLELSNRVCCEEELEMYILEWTSTLFKVEQLHWFINSTGHVILLHRYHYFSISYYLFFYSASNIVD